MIISTELNNEELPNEIRGNNSTSAIVESLLFNGKSLTKIKIKGCGQTIVKIRLSKESDERYPQQIMVETIGLANYEYQNIIYEEKILSEEYYKKLRTNVNDILEDLIATISSSFTSWKAFELELKKQPKRKRWNIFGR